MIRYIITMNERNMNLFPLACWRAGFVMMHDLAGTSRSTMPAVSDAKLFMQAVNVCFAHINPFSSLILIALSNRIRYQCVFILLMC
jgi:hypothetical protein